jgi:hypothetical protein
MPAMPAIDAIPMPGSMPIMVAATRRREPKSNPFA